MTDNRIQSMPPTRRGFLSRLGVAAGMLPFSGWLTSGAYAQTVPRVRYEVFSPKGLAMLNRYSQAVGIMKDRLPAHHPHSWRFQTSIHAVANTGDLPPGTNPADEDIDTIFRAKHGENAATVMAHRKLALGAEPGGQIGDDRTWSTCPHHTPTRQFLPWHRFYLAYFEQIIEKVLGKPFSLPYWDYFNPAKRHLPPMFAPQFIGGRKNPLYFAARSSEFKRNGLSADVIPVLNDPDKGSLLKNPSLLGTPRRFGFNNELEGQLHDLIHGSVGTRFGMANVSWAARDPIFWLHHANIDRVWESWRRPGPDGSSSLDPGNGDAWYNAQYAFVNAAGAAVRSDSPDRAMRAAFNLKYKYDFLIPLDAMPLAVGEAAGPSAPTKTHEGSAANAKIRGANDSVTIPLAPAAPDGVALGLSTNTATRWALNLKLLTAPAPGLYRVFMENSLGTTGATQAPVQIGVFSLFSLQGANGHVHTGSAPMETTVELDITGKVRDHTIDPLRPGKLSIKPAYLEDPVDITVRGVEIIAK